MQRENAWMVVCVRERDHSGIFCITDIKGGVLLNMKGGWLRRRRV